MKGRYIVMVSLLALVAMAPMASAFQDDFNYVGNPNPAKWNGPWGNVAVVNGSYGDFNETTYSSAGGLIQSPTSVLTTFDFCRPTQAHSGNTTLRFRDGVAWPWSGLCVLEITPVNVTITALQGGVGNTIKQIPTTLDTWYSVSVLGNAANNQTTVKLYDRATSTLIDQATFAHDAAGPWEFHWAATAHTYLDNVNIVPEPATMLLLGIGAFATLRRKH